MSAWGGRWGGRWGDRWGSVVAAVAAVNRGTFGGIRPLTMAMLRRNQRRAERVAREERRLSDEDEALLMILLNME